MRPLAPSDLSVAARMLLTLPKPARATAMKRLIGEAEAADRYCKRLRKSHPFWGNGSLEGAARLRPMAPQQSYSNTDYLSCLSLVLEALVLHRQGKAQSRTRLRARDLLA